MTGRVGLIGENSIEYIDKLLDIWNHGDCAVLIDWRIPYQAAIEMMRDANVSVCYAEQKWLSNTFSDAPNDIEFISFNRNSNSAELVPHEIYNKFCESYSHDEAVVIYSSGTTGRAKGIILSHYAINTNADAIIDYMRPTKHDCLYIAKTISHSSTITGELLVALKTRTPLVIAPTIVPPRFVLHAINEFNISILCLNPTLLKMYTEACKNTNYDLETLKTIYVSGEILNDRVYREAHEVFQGSDIYNVYGLSEAGPRVTAQRKDCCKSNSVGRAIKDATIVIVDSNGDIVRACEHGIIHVLTPSLFSGYVFGANKFSSLYKGYLNTGDIGYWDENKELHIINRVDDVIFIGAHKIYPSDISNKIIEISNVEECVIRNINFHGKNILSCLYLSSIEISSQIKRKLKKELLQYEIPKIFIRNSFIPKTKTNKIDLNKVDKIIINKLERILT